ncbi:PadR family transcriptional regulator [Verticiella sediminum]|uniref:PadR family transcriptional regulator n=1 Tax=Verticiella sediminum TaxID=1247510 RepID=A0A556AYE4_9BURK|nr:PadR family transcriptional regulator [Verticiella sediminum]TSH97974.1 PadR family transcriptional regulator [Verticiella sediminum]
MTVFSDQSLVRGRKFPAQDVQLMLLTLLAQGSTHGYALTRQLATLSHGFYHPSPGVMYPALAAMHRLGWVDVDAGQGRKNYRITDAGRAHLAAERERAELLFAQLEHASRKMAWLKHEARGEPFDIGADGEDLASGFLPDYVLARQTLRRALLRHAQATPAQQRKIAAILRRASAELARIPAVSPAPAVLNDPLQESP